MTGRDRRAGANPLDDRAWPELAPAENVPGSVEDGSAGWARACS
jgi:hypothetical protein